MGCFIGLIGLLLFLNRASLAGTFLGANLLFGMPLGEEDSQKVTVVAFGGLGTMAVGGLAFVVGAAMALVAFSKGK